MEHDMEMQKMSMRLDPVEMIGAVDTNGVAQAVLQWLTDNKIHHTVFARTVLGWNSAFTPLLRKPTPWPEADVRTQKAYQSMYCWLQRPHEERLATVREKQDQMNRKRRNESNSRDQHRIKRRPDPASAGSGFSFNEDSLSQPEYTGLDGANNPLPLPPSAPGSEFDFLQQYDPTPVQAPPPPSYRDTVQQQLGGYSDRPPPLYNAPLPGYEELNRNYAPPPPGPLVPEVRYSTQLPPVSEVLQETRGVSAGVASDIGGVGSNINGVVCSDIAGVSGAVGSDISGVSGVVAGDISGVSGGVASDISGVSGGVAGDISGVSGGVGSDISVSVSISGPLVDVFGQQLPQQPAQAELEQLQQQLHAQLNTPPLPQPLSASSPPQLLAARSPSPSPSPLPTPEPPAEPRPARIQITPLQRRALVDIFHVTARPSTAMRQLIAATLDLPQRTVSNFFSSARTRGLSRQRAAAAAGSGAAPAAVQQQPPQTHVM